MSLLRCCCGGVAPTADGPCPAYPSGSTSRSYRINLPEFLPLVYGRVVPGHPYDIYDQGICAGNTTHAAWAPTPCTWHSSLFYYHIARTYPNCTGATPYYCHIGYGPYAITSPARGITFNQASLGVTQYQSFQQYFTNSSASPNAWYSLQVTFVRCHNVGCNLGSWPYWNRSGMYVLLKFNGKQSVQDCLPGGPVSVRNRLSEYQAFYQSDPFDSATMVPSTMYLKELSYQNPLSDDPNCWDTDYWGTDMCLKSWERGAVLTNQPINVVPSTITIDRLA